RANTTFLLTTCESLAFRLRFLKYSDILSGSH
ncbi:hypothetical protein A2U01_0096076, partial [Trifolium medium]|nr:hypothetical protein [Trifolium medium]